MSGSYGVRDANRRFILIIVVCLGLAALAPTNGVDAAVRQFVGLYGGEVHHVAFSQDGATLLAGTRQGMFRSIDDGATWLPAVTGIERRFVSDIEFHPTDSSVVFATAGGGLFRSIDAGVTWHSREPRFDPAMVDAAVSRSSPHRLVAAEQRAVHVSNDAGATWTSVFDESDALPLEQLYVLSVAIDPQDPDSIFTCAQRELDGHAYNDLYHSADGGGTWARLRSFTNCGEFVWNPQSNGEVWLSDGMQPWRSTDSGMSWTAVNNLGGSTYDIAFSADGSGVFVGGTEWAAPRLWVSRNGGASWLKYTPAATGAVAPAPHDANLVVLGTSAGIHVTRDGGGSFAKSNTGMAAQPVVAVATRARDSGTIFASLRSSGLFRSDDAGLRWTEITPLHMVTEGITADAGNTVYITGERAFDGAVASSADNGATWSWGDVPEPLSPREIIAHPTAPGRLLMATHWRTAATPHSPLLRSDDSGATWQPSGPAGQGALDIERHRRTEIVHALMHQADGSKLFRSDDFGTTWRRVPIPDDITAFATGATPDELYVGGSTIYRSLNGGDSWRQAEGFVPWAITVMAVDPLDSHQVLAGTQNGGLWLSVDQGVTWQRIFSQGSGEAVEAIAFAPSERPDDATDLPARPALVGAGRWTRSGLVQMTFAPHPRRGAHIDGRARLGETLTCRRGRWSRADTFRYSWFRSGELLQRQAVTKQVYRADLGHRVRCRVIANGPGGSSRSRSDYVVPRR